MREVSPPLGQDAVRQYLEAKRDEHLNLLRELVRQPSISAQNIGMEACARLVQQMMTEFGIAAEVKPTPGHPVIVGHVQGDSPFTVLFYGHYDVQPPEPLEAWHSPPFEPTVRDGRLYGRGTGDNKGQFLAHLLAVRALLEVEGRLPVSVKFIFEGEEESGSVNLPAFVEREQELLRADFAVTADGGMHPSARPVIYYGCRGILYVEASAQGANQDYHSGNRGGVLPTPAWELVHFLSDLKGPDGTVRLPGFYDGVRAPSAEEEGMLAALPFDGEQFLREHGLTGRSAPQGVDYYRALMFEPTMNISGLVSGYGGPGAKTIIPHEARAKLDMRLVPGQDPEAIFARMEAWAKERHPSVALKNLWSWPASYTQPTLPVCRQVEAAVEDVWSQPPLKLPLMGGSVPNFVFTQTLGIPAVIVPYANHDEDNHAPNENIRLDCFYKGIETSVAILRRLAELS